MNRREMKKAIRDSRLLLKNKSNGKILYAIIEEKWGMVGGHLTWVPNGCVYVHADSQGDARIVYANTKSPRCRAVSIAPAIGFFMNDNHKDLFA